MLHKPFIAETTYNAELIKSGEVARAAYRATDALRPTLTNSLNALKRSTKGAGATLESAPEGKRFGYVTEYTAMVVEDPKTGGLAASGRLPSAPPQVEARERVLTRTLKPKFSGSSIYTQNHGSYGFNPMERAPGVSKEITSKASTGEFNAGTTRSTDRIPGYCGYIPCASGTLFTLTATWRR